MEIKATKEKQKLKGTVEIEIDFLRRKPFAECLEIIDIHLLALRTELKNVMVDEIFSRGEKKNEKKT